nr:MAG TPA: hypothetical protein [Bacteriophage sp.]
MKIKIIENKKAVKSRLIDNIVSIAVDGTNASSNDDTVVITGIYNYYSKVSDSLDDMLLTYGLHGSNIKDAKQKGRLYYGDFMGYDVNIKSIPDKSNPDQFKLVITVSVN